MANNKTALMDIDGGGTMALVVDNRTDRGYPLPYFRNHLRADVIRLGEATEKIDGDIRSHSAEIELKANDADMKERLSALDEKKADKTSVEDKITAAVSRINSRINALDADLGDKIDRVSMPSVSVSTKVTFDFGTVESGKSVTRSIAAEGLDVGPLTLISVSPLSDFPDGITFNAWAGPDGKIYVRCGNMTGSAVALARGEWAVSVSKTVGTAEAAALRDFLIAGVDVNTLESRIRSDNAAWKELIGIQPWFAQCVKNSTTSASLAASETALTDIASSEAAVISALASETLIRALVGSSSAFAVIMGDMSVWRVLAGTSSSMAIIAASPSAMAAVAASEDAMTAAMASAPAILKMSASAAALEAISSSESVLNRFINDPIVLKTAPGDITAMTAIAASSTAMTAIAASSTAMTAIAASSTAMTAIAASSTAMTAIAASSTAMTAIAASSTAMNKIVASSAAVAAVEGSATAVNAVCASETGSSIMAKTWAIGVVDTGARTDAGATLKQIYGDFSDATLNTAFFNVHPCYKFTDTTLGSDAYVKIPRAYWKRGTVPSGKPNAGKWFMMISDKPLYGFKASSAFKYKGADKDCFYIMKYRAYNNGNKPGSKSGQTHWGNITFNDAITNTAALGAGYHVLSIQEWHEICARAVIEKKTFDIMPMSVRGTQASCVYRGIYDFCFSGSVNREWLSGIRTNANIELEVWDKNGNQSYVNTKEAPKVNDLYIKTLLTGDYFDDIFIAATGDGTISNSMIPNYNRTSSASCVCVANFYSSSAYCGAFCSYLGVAATSGISYIGFRAAKN